jgi:hypothetical protein
MDTGVSVLAYSHTLTLTQTHVWCVHVSPTQSNEQRPWQPEPAWPQPLVSKWQTP